MKFKGKQEIIDHVVAFFKHQKKPGIRITDDGNLECVYRNDKNYCACAIGCLIPKGQGIKLGCQDLAGVWDDSYIRDYFPKEIDLYFFLEELLNAHDRSAIKARLHFNKERDPSPFSQEEEQFFMKEFDRRLRIVAVRFNLAYEAGSLES